MNESEINLDNNSKDLVHVYLESVLSVVTFVLVELEISKSRNCNISPV